VVHPYGLPPAFAFTTRRGLSPAHSRLWATPWSVFQDGPLVAITPASLQKRGPRTAPAHYVARYNTLRKEPRSRYLLVPAPTDAGPSPAECTGEKAG
jgi:hypothetical protein